MSGDLSTPETGNAIPQDKTRCLNILNSDKGLEIIEKTISKDESFLDDDDDDEDPIHVENITAVKAEMAKSAGRRISKKLECVKCNDCLAEDCLLENLIVSAERVFQTFLNKGVLHKKNIRGVMVNIVAEKIEPHDCSHVHDHNSVQKCLEQYFNDRLFAYGKSLTANFKKMDRRQPTTKLVQFLGQ
jgi:hypothetical protein